MEKHFDVRLPIWFATQTTDNHNHKDDIII